MAAVFPNDEERDRNIPGRRDDDGDADNPLLEGTDLDKNDEVQELPDGGALVISPEGPANESQFDENLAETLDENEMDIIARDLIRRIEQDKDARSKRDAQYEEGLKRTGLGDDAPGGAQFTGASKVVHPMLTEASVDFAASAMKELFPPSGPVRTEIIGEQTPDQLAVSDRQFKYMNWQLTEQIEEYADELAVTMTQLPLGGSQYMKFWDDDIEDRPMTEFVPIDDLLIPYSCSNFWSASRITHVQRLSESTYEDRVESEMYRDTELAAPAETPTPTKAGAASERIEGVEQPPENLDGVRIVYETNTFLKLSVDKEKRLPYLISIDERTGKVLSIYRNWEEEDKRRKRLHWIVDYNFIAWRGAYKLGLGQMIGGLSAAATGALRALLDSALVQTIPVLAKLKAAKFGAQSKSVDPMSMIDIEAGTGVDDIRKALMALPFNPPSPTLFQLLGWLSDAAKGVVTTAEEKIADAGNQMPVGTSLALIEQGAKVFSSIHAGLHRSQKKALKIIARINKGRVDTRAQIEKFGSVICTSEDFRKPLGVIPVSDPNIFSEGQRYAQMQLVQANVTAFPQLHDIYEVLHSSYTLAKIPNIDKVLPKPKKPTEMNAVAENSSVMLGNPVMAFPEQNHFAHLETHMRFITDPLLGGNPAAVPKSWPTMIEHIKQHLAFLYAQQMHEICTKELGQDVSEIMKDRKRWPEVDALLAAASRIVHDNLSQVLAPLGPTINRMIQQIEQMKPPPPMDPSQAALKVAGMEDQRSREQGKSKDALTAQQLAEKAEKDRRDADARDQSNEIAATKVALDHGRESLDLEHTHALDAAGHALAADQQAHGQQMDLAGHGLDAAAQAQQQQTAEGDQALAQGDQAMKRGGQVHEHALDVAGHNASVQNEAHARAMAEAEHAETQRQNDLAAQQEEARRQDERARAETEAKARANKPKGDKS